MRGVSGDQEHCHHPAHCGHARAVLQQVESCLVSIMCILIQFRSLKMHIFWWSKLYKQHCNPPAIKAVPLMHLYIFSSTVNVTI